MLETIYAHMYKVVNFYKDTNKLQSYLTKIEPNIIIDIYTENFAENKINYEQKIQVEFNKLTGTPIYKTQKCYKSSKLDKIFTDFLKFLTIHNERVEAYILLSI
jgi:hypothetical protein